MSNRRLNPLREAVARLEAAWADAGDATEMSRTQLLAVNEAIGALHRHADALHAEAAAAISHESRAELGPDSLAKQQGFRNPTQLIAATSGVSGADAARIVTVGEATARRTNLVGETLPARYPAVREALSAGRITAQVAALIVGMLDRVRVRVSGEVLSEGEQLLAGKAPGLALDDVRKLLVRVEAWIDPDGVAPREEDHRARRSLTMFERDGDLHLNGVFDAESAAPIKAALRGYVTAAFQARQDAVEPAAPDADRRPVPVLQADTLSILCAHALSCDNGGVPLAGATVVVRVTLEDLMGGSGSATVDGTDQPISIGAARRLAASGGVIPCVLGEDSEILDWGREKRFFTRAQKLALAERDGGCAMCGLPPEMTKAHHIRWWTRDTGPTDLDNGILLCESCHHRIHDNGWDIRITGTGVTARPWFIPPPNVDPQQIPRLGGRARYDVAAA